MAIPKIRVAVDWDNDLFICYEAAQTDGLNRLHTGLASDPGLVNLHWNYINKSGINSAAVSFTQEETVYGLRKLQVVTGTNTTAGAYFGRTGSTNDFNVTNATVYTAVFWIKASVGSGVGMTFLMENSSGSQTFTLSSAWQKITRTFTTTGTTTSFKITKTNSATNCTFEVTGFMIVAGAIAPGGFNVGHATNLYDIISADVESCAIKIGRANRFDTMPAEGTANLLLKNTTRRYSPGYSGSPLYGYMLQDLRMTVDFQDPVTSSWVRKFAGWSSSYAPKPGKNLNKTTDMNSVQGIKRLEQMKYPDIVTGTITANTLIKAVIMRGYPSAATALQALADRSKAGACYCVDPAAILSLDVGVSSINVSGEDWGAGGSAAKVISDLMEVERGFFFIDGNGVVKFFNRHHYVDPALKPTAVVIDLDDEAISPQHVHGANYHNKVRVTYRPKNTRVGVAWQSKEDLVLRPNEKSKEIDVRFEYEEEKKMTVTAVQAFDGAANASTYTALSGAANVASKTQAEFKLENGRGKLTLRNFTQRTVRFAVTVRGTIQESYGGNEVEVVDASGLRSGQQVLRANVRQISEEQEATNLANFLLGLYKDALGEFTSIQFISRNNTWLQRALNNGLGTLLSLSEYQTGDSGKYIVVGEQHDWTPGRLQTTLLLYPEFRNNKYWILGTSVLGTDTWLGY